MMSLHLKLFIFVVLSLPAHSQPSDLSEVSGILGENLFLGGGSLEASVVRLPQFISANYGYRIDCKSGYFSKMKPTKCALGLRLFARQLYSGKIAEGKKWSKVLHLTITEDTNVKTAIEDGVMHFYFPYTIEDAALVPLFQRLLAGPDLREALNQDERLNLAWDDLQSQIPAKLSIDPDLSIFQKWSAVVRLSAITEKDPGLFENQAEIIKIGLSFERLHEAKMQTEITVDSRASPEKMATFLESARRKRPLELRTDGAIHFERERIASAQQNLLEKFSYSVDCSVSGELSTVSCLHAEERLYSWLEQSKPRITHPLNILVLEPAQLDSCCEIFTHPKTGRVEVLLASRFTPPELKDFLTKKGLL